MEFHEIVLFYKNFVKLSNTLDSYGNYKKKIESSIFWQKTSSLFSHHIIHKNNFWNFWHSVWSSFWRNREKEVVVVFQPLSEKAKPKADDKWDRRRIRLPSSSRKILNSPKRRWKIFLDFFSLIFSSSFKTDKTFW